MLHTLHTSLSVRTLCRMALIGMLSSLLLVLSACGPGGAATTTGSGGSDAGSTATATATSAKSPTATATSAKSPTATATSAKSPTATPGTALQGPGVAHGCPSNAVVSTAPTQANVMIGPKDINAVVTAHVGNVIEVEFPFGTRWGGPTTIPSNLQQDQPAGYASPSGNVCVWRFTATGTGMANLEFHAQALCSMGQECPMFIELDPISIDVK